MCEYKLVWSSYSRMPHSASCVNPNPVYSCMILGAIIAGDVPAFCFRSCKIRFDARVRIICRCSRMPRSASCLNPKLVYCSMIFSAYYLQQTSLRFVFTLAKSVLAHGFAADCQGGGRGAGRLHNTLSPHMRVSHNCASTYLYGVVIHACLTPPLALTPTPFTLA